MTAARAALSTLSTRVDGPVLHVRMHGRDSGNVIDADLLDDLSQVLPALQDRPDLRVLVLDGDGTDFSLGADRDEFARRTAADPSGADVRRLGHRAKLVCDALESTDALTVARIQGRAVGAGLALASFCDLRAGTADVTFRMPELAVGLSTTWGGAMARLISEIGAARFRELALTCDVLDAHTAHSYGLLHRVAGTAEELDAIVDRWASSAARRPADALATTKTLLRAYTSPGRLGDLTALDAHLLSAAVTARHAAQTPPPGPGDAQPPSPSRNDEGAPGTTRL